jgi:phosphatidylglycerophosphate synthase
LTLIKAQVIAADRGGKVKTAIQIAAISIALFNEEFQFQPLDFLLPIFYGVAVIVTLWTGVNYIRSFGGSRA